MSAKIYLSRGDPFRYWFTDIPVPGTVECECTEMEKQVLDLLQKQAECMNMMLREIDRRRVESNDPKR